jgi:pimeloyl-ACP methyl ester carboxylesterase
MQQLTRDGIRLAFESRGQGEPPMLFVHGWCCDHTYFRPQMDHFAAWHRTVSIDLRGHGSSDAPVQDYSMDAFVDDLVWTCTELQLKKPILVGHSMGGVIGLTLAGRFPDLLSGLVMVDSPVHMLLGRSPTPEDRGRVAARVAERFSAQDYLDVARRLIDSFFLSTDDPIRRAEITQGMLATPRHVMASSISNISACDLISAAQASSVPLLYIQAASDREGLEELAALCPGAVIARTAGSGHFNQLEVPEQVNAMIERFLRTSVLA